MFYIFHGLIIAHFTCSCLLFALCAVLVAFIVTPLVAVVVNNVMRPLK